jgi:hypothetical protein
MDIPTPLIARDVHDLIYRRSVSVLLPKLINHHIDILLPWSHHFTLKLFLPTVGDPESSRGGVSIGISSMRGDKFDTPSPSFSLQTFVVRTFSSMISMTCEGSL